MLQDGGSGTIPEEDTCVAVGPINDTGELVGTDHQHGSVGSGSDELARRFDPEEEPGAGRGKIEACRIDSTDLGLHEARGAGEEHIGRDGGANDQVDFPGCDAGVLQCSLGRIGSQVTGWLLQSGNAALPNSGAGTDPLVACLDQFLEFGIGQHFFRNITSGSDNGGREGRWDASLRHERRWRRGLQRSFRCRTSPPQRCGD